MKLQKKFEPISSYLYVTSGIQSDDISKIINEVRPYLIIDFRTNKNDWYKNNIRELENINLEETPKDAWKIKKYKYNKESSFTTIDFEFITEGSDLKHLCKRIVLEYMQENKRVLLCCHDGITTCGYISKVCQWWYEGGDMTRDLVKELRANNDFITAKDKYQQREMKEIMSYAKNIINWKNFCKK